VKAKDKNAKPDAGKQKKQLLMLGGLVAVLGVVVAVQFGGSEPTPEVAALAQDPAAIAAASSAPEAGAAAASSPQPAAPTSNVSDNPVLSQPVEAESLPRSPFANFWNVAASGGSAVAGPLPDIAPPVVTLNATLPSDTRALAVIDGELYFVGDMVQGWELSDVQPRRIMLRSPSQAMVTIDMPLLAGSVAVPVASDG
jgi:hypothetical protein